MPQVAVLSNPSSTTNRGQFDRVRSMLSEARNIFHYELDTVERIPEALSIFASTKPDLLVINGGDGTIQATLSALLNDNPFGKKAPPIGILPGGKTNMIAEDLGCYGRVEKVMNSFIRVTRDGTLGQRTIKRHLIELDLGTGQPPLFGMFFGGAGMVNGIKYCREHIYPMKLPNMISHVMAVGALTTSALGGGERENSPMHSNPMKIVMPAGGVLEGRFMMVVATTLDRLLLGMRPYGREGKGNLKFSAVEHRPGAIVSATRGVITGTFGRATLGGVATRRINEIRISGDDPVTLDGEIYDIAAGQTITLRGDKSLEFLSLRKSIE